MNILEDYDLWKRVWTKAEYISDGHEPNTPKTTLDIYEETILSFVGYEAHIFFGKKIGFATDGYFLKPVEEYPQFPIIIIISNVAEIILQYPIVTMSTKISGNWTTDDVIDFATTTWIEKNEAKIGIGYTPKIKIDYLASESEVEDCLALLRLSV